MTTDAGTLPNSAPLDELVREIGPMPTHLACDFIHQAAGELAARHATGEAHGSLSPAALVVGPLVTSSRRKPDGSPLKRPGPDAKVKLLDHEARPEATPANDIRDLTAALCFLLTGRESVTADAIAKLRPDLPTHLLSLIQNGLANDPNSRPNLGTFRQHLLAYLPSPVTTQADVPAPVVEPDAAPSHEVPLGSAVGEPSVSLSAPSHDWVAVPLTDPTPSADGFAMPDASEPAVRRRELTPEESRSQLRFWAKIGVGMWILSIPLWYVFLNTYGCTGSSEQPAPEPTKTRRR